jgi:hypothetical protein
MLTRSTRGLVGAASGTAYNQPVTHGDQLTLNDVGPWALQAVPKGTEALQGLTGPGRGFWRFDTPDEFSSSAAWPSNANDSNPSILNAATPHEGTVTGSPVTIDGYSIPVGTRIVQFRDFPNGYDFYAQGTSLKILFRGCRFRFTDGLGGSGLFNDSGATTSQQIMLHYCDVGLTGRDLAAGAAGIMHIKNLGGQNHRYLRGYHTLSSTFFQPNTQGCAYIENWIDDFVFFYGESGTSGGFDSSVFHMNGISSEGALTSLTIARNHILAPSPDGATGANGFTAAGQSGYGTQPGQTGYGSGTNPGRVIGQTDCIALFALTGSNIGSSPGAILIDSNLLGGTGVPLYAGNANSGAQNIWVINNKWTTKYWTNGGQFGSVTDQPTWGSNGNAQSGNVWADDYGTGGNGSTALADRQYPAGNGPRAGTSVI